MEPMNLGSPTNSPSNSSTTYLPSFLMGEPQTPKPRTNTLSPNKIEKNMSFNLTNQFTPTTSERDNSHLIASPADYNRSILNQKTLFNKSCQQITSLDGTPNSLQQHQQSELTAVPPTQGLFDSLRMERNQVHTPNKLQKQFGSQINLMGNQFSQNGSSQRQQQHNINNTNASFLYNDPATFNNSNSNDSCNLTRATSLTHVASNCGTPLSSTSKLNNFWVTVYGFPSSAVTLILQHFLQCGTIVDKIFPSQNCNWIHLKFSSRLECDKALKYNEKILGNNIMIGVTLCKDKNIITEKDNYCENVENINIIRPLAQVAYKSAQDDTSVLTTSCTAQKSSGLVNKALDLFFGW